MKVFPLLLIAAIGVFAFKDEISRYAGKAKAIADASSAVSKRAGELERHGGKRTTADLRWISQMNVLCARRNTAENRISLSGDTTQALARYAQRTLAIWDGYARRAAALRVPPTYTEEATVLRTADDARRRGIEAVLVAARSGDFNASHAAIDSFGDVSQRMRSNLIQVGLDRCADFNP